jgi:hypothetical protein
MKKPLLLILGILAFGVVGAQTPAGYIKATQPSLLKLQPLNRTSVKYGTGDESVFIGPPSSTVRTDGQAPGSVVIGTTIYDLQTNSSVARRLLMHEGGAMTAVYTMAQDASYTDRGSGYAYHNGTDWTVLNATDCLEPIKTGWPTIAILNGKEFDISHDGTNYQMQQGVSNGIGLGTPADWTFTQSGASVPVDGSGSVHGPIWPRLAVNGNFLHVISSFQITDSANIISGVKAPFTYSRSTDGGATWTANIPLENYDNTRSLYGSADDYDIDYNAGTTAMVHGGLGEDVSFWKSTDDGATWVHTYVDSFEYAPDYAATAPIDLELPTNDGSVSLVVDDNGKAHVAYAECQVVNDATIGAAFQPGWIGLRYWTEGMDTAFAVCSIGSGSLPGEFDTDGDGSYLVGSTTTDAGYARYVNNALLCKPSISYDALGDIFITFSLPNDADTTFDGQSFRDIFIAYHRFEDPIETWGFANITATYFVEEAFATAARVVDDAVHITYQEDFEPGTALTNLDPADFNNINYIEWANPFITGVEQPVNYASAFSVKQNYPNPFTDQTQLQITVKTAADVNVNMTNLLGEIVWENNYTFGAGIHDVTLTRGNLSSGVYFYNVTAGNETISGKMIVE